MSETRIRSAAAADLGAVVALWGETTSPRATDTERALEALLATDSRALLVAEQGDLALGTVIAAWDGWRGSLYRLAVRTTHRRRGIATALVREGEQRLRARGARRVTAIVDERDAEAIAFWQAAGYVRVPEQARLVRNFPTAHAPCEGSQ